VFRPIVWLSSGNSENMNFKITIADFIQDQNEITVILLQNAHQ